MRKPVTVLVALAVTSAIFPLPSAAGQEIIEAPFLDRTPQEREYFDGRAIVGVRRSEKAEAEDSIADQDGDVVDYNRHGSFFVVETPTDSSQWADRIEDDRSIRYAEPDWEINVDDLAPTDPSWPSLWGMTQISAPAGWSETTGSREIVVGVIDTGIDYTHEDLVGQMWINPDENPSTSVDDDKHGWVNDVHGADCYNDDGDPMDDNDHGTHVAGTIGAAANNGKGVAGVNWNVSLMGLKFLDSSGSGYLSDAVQCIYYAIDNGAHLTNNSWGGGGYSQTMYDAIRAARDKNQLFIAAAGNSGRNNDSAAHYPSSYALDNVISVAATDGTDTLASFSNYGSSSVDLGAPGVSILSTVRGGYESWKGTSMAAPHVAGGAALLLAKDRRMTDDHLGVRSALLDGVDVVPALAGKVATGGRLDIAQSLTLLDTGPEITSFTPGEGSSVAGSVTLRVAAVDDTSVNQVEFLVGSTSLGLGTLDETGVWTLPWDTTTVADGTWAVHAVATDDAGDRGAATVQLRVDNVDDPPRISITSPAASSNVSGTVQLVAAANDDRGVSVVEFFVDGVKVGEDTSPDGGWTASWAAPSVDGSRVVTAQATDTGGQVTTSAPVTVTVTNPAVSLHVHDLDASKTSINRLEWKVSVVVTVMNNKEAAVSSAYVSVSWSTGNTSTCQTGSTGKCTVTSPRLKKSTRPQVTASVSSLKRTGLVYAPADNHNSDGDPGATGSSITVNWL